MGLLNTFAKWIVSKSGESVAAAGIIRPWQDQKVYRPIINHKALIERYSSWAYSCIDRNSGTLARIPLRLYVAKPNKGGKANFPTRSIDNKVRDFLHSKGGAAQKLTSAGEVEEVLEHPILDVLKKVNDFMNSFELKYLTTASLEATGNSYWYKVRNNIGMITEIWPLYPQFMKIVAEKNNLIKHFEYGNNQSNMQKIKPKDIIHFKYPSLKSSLYGMGPLEAGVVAIDLSNAMNTHEVALHINGGVPEMKLTYPPEVIVDPKQKKRIELDYYKKYRGDSKQGRLTILTGGADLQPVSLSPKEMAFLQGRKWSLQEIAGVFGVPMSKLMVQEISRANARDANREYMAQTISPKCILIEEKLNEQFVSEFDSNLFLAFDNPVPEDIEFRLKERTENIKVNYTSINEERIRDGLEPIEWGNEPAKGNPPPSSSPKLVKNKTENVPPMETPAFNYDPSVFIEQLSKYFRKMGNEILGQINEDSFKSLLRYESAEIKYYSAKAIPDDLVSGWFNMDKWDKELAETVFPHVRATMIIGGDEALKDLAASTQQLDTMNPNVLQSLQRHNGAIRGINRTQQKIVRKAITAGIEAGEGVNDIRKRIMDVFKKSSSYGAKRIARTEMIWAYNEGKVKGYIQSGVVRAKQWIVAADERMCEFCGTMTDKIVEVEKEFFPMGAIIEGNQGGKLLAEYEAIEHPPLHPMCRCTLVPILVGE